MNLKLEETENRRRLHIGSYFTDLNENEYRELVKIFSDPSRQEQKCEFCGWAKQDHRNGRCYEYSDENEDYFYKDKFFKEPPSKDWEIENLMSVMVAAAEEIQEHWQAHCDEDGYGPANLMHRLEKGIAANYPGYKPGAFKECWDKIEKQQIAMQKMFNAMNNSLVVLSDYSSKHYFDAKQLIDEISKEFPNISVLRAGGGN